MKVKILFILFIFACFGTAVKAQQTVEDSLKASFFNAKEDADIINRLEDLATFYSTDATKSPEERFRQIQTLIKRKDPKLDYLLLFYRVVFLHTPDSTDESLKYLYEFLEQCRIHNDKKNYAFTLVMLSVNESYSGYYDKAFKLLFHALDYARDTLKDREMIGGVYLSLAVLYYEHNDTLKAIEFNKLALKEMTEINQLDMMASVNNNLALQYSDLGKYDSAEFYFRESIRLFHKDNEDPHLRKPLINLAEVFRLTQQYDSAIIYTRNAIHNAILLQDNASLGDAYFQIAKTFTDIGELDSAGRYYLMAKENIEMYQSEPAFILFYINLADFYTLKGDYKLAYEYLQKAVAIKDLIFNTENNKVLKEMDVKYQATQKEKEILIQEEQIKRQQILNYSMLAVAVFFLLLIFFIRKTKRQLEEKNKLVEAARERAERSEKFKQQFLANMSHEIRTPMNAVMGMTNLLIDKNPRIDQRKYLEGIQKSSDNLLHIINDILDLSKIEAGKIELEQIDFSIPEVVHQVEQTLRHKAEEKGLQLIISIDPLVPEIVIGDPGRLNQILMNLAGNAIKFTEKGSVTFKVTPTTDRSIEFSIIDTGIGIARDKLQSVFENFSQAHASDTRKFGGTGLGLTICKQLVELMGGKILIESEEGSGSTFLFTLEMPIGSKEKLLEQKSSEQIDESILNGLKILLVDDNIDNRIVARDTLELNASLTIVEAINGKEAIEKLSMDDFDIVLMDVQMPVMDGYEATRQIRNDILTSKKDIPIIALTASVIRSDLDKCRAAGMNDYVPKPFKTYQLITSIAKLTGREIKYKPKDNGQQTINKEQSPIINGHPDNYRESIVDLTYLEEFCEGDKTRMHKYINIFLDSAPVLIEKINAALHENNFQKIANQLHGFKTKFIMMGMHEANEIATKMELDCRKEISDYSLVKKDTAKLLNIISEAINELKKVQTML